MLRFNSTHILSLVDLSLLQSCQMTALTHNWFHHGRLSTSKDQTLSIFHMLWHLKDNV